RACYTRSGDRDPHDIRADTTRGNIVWFRPIIEREIIRYGVNDSAAARGWGGYERGQKGIGQCDAIAKEQSVFAHALDDHESNALAQTRSLIAKCEQEGSKYQPDGWITVSGQCPAEGRVRGAKARLGQLLRTEQSKTVERSDKRYADDGNGSAGEGFENESEDDRDKNGKEIPRMVRQTRRDREQGENRSSNHRRQCFPCASRGLRVRTLT